MIVKPLITIDSVFHMVFEIKNEKLYFTLDAPKEKFSFTIQQLSSGLCPEGKIGNIQENDLGVPLIFDQAGTYIFSINRNKLRIKFKKNKLAFTKIQ